MRKTAEFQHLVGLRMVVKGGPVNHVLGCHSLTRVKSTYNQVTAVDTVLFSDVWVLSVSIQEQDELMGEEKSMEEVEPSV